MRTLDQLFATLYKLNYIEKRKILEYSLRKGRKIKQLKIYNMEVLHKKDRWISFILFISSYTLTVIIIDIPIFFNCQLSQRKLRT